MTAFGVGFIFVRLVLGSSARQDRRLSRRVLVAVVEAIGQAMMLGRPE